MKGEVFARIVEKELADKGIPKGDFYRDTGISATALYGWKRGSEPKRDTVSAVEKYFGIDLSSYEQSFETNENIELMELLRDRPDLKLLMRSAKDVPASSVFSLIAQVQKWKEEAQ